MKWAPHAMAFMLLACGDDAADVVGLLGMACGAGNTSTYSACAAELVCRDGRCVERGDVSVADTDLAPSIRIEVTPSEAEITADVTPEVDAGPVTVWVGEHAYLTQPSDMRLSLGVGQVAVRELQVPRGRPTQLEIYTTSLPPLPGCARFRATLWLPDAVGAFTVSPSWQATGEVLLTDVAGPQVASLGDMVPEVAAGVVRVGLSYLGPCDGGSYGPWIALDSTGDAGDSFVWAGNWIPGQSLSLAGHWAFRMAIVEGLP